MINQKQKKMNNQELIGKKVRGFKFETEDCLLYGYGDSMDKYIGVEGEIWIVNEKENAAFVKFKCDGYYYPLDQIQAHLVEETKEESKAINFPIKEEIVKVLYSCVKAKQTENGIEIERFFDLEAQAIIDLFTKLNQN